VIESITHAINLIHIRLFAFVQRHKEWFNTAKIFWTVLLHTKSISANQSPERTRKTNYGFGFFHHENLFQQKVSIKQDEVNKMRKLNKTKIAWMLLLRVIMIRSEQDDQFNSNHEFNDLNDKHFTLLTNWVDRNWQNM